MNERRKRRREGMTLIEIMVVITIMALIAVAVAINVMKAIDGSNVKETERRARTVQSAALMYVTSGRRGCPTVEALLAEDYLDTTTESTDAWGGTYRIECEGLTLHVRSDGPDGIAETDDDVGF